MGKTAEKIVAQMFEEAGYKVINYGYEYTVPELADRNNLIKGDAANFIRHQPDLIVVDKDNNAFFIEVKFRREGKILKKHMFNYPACYVVLITKDHLYGQSLNDIYRRGENFVFLNKLEPFNQISTDLISRYVKKIRRQLGDETITGQLVEGLIKKITGKNLHGPKPTTGEVVDRKFTIGGWERIDFLPKWAYKKMKISNSGIVNGKYFRYKEDKSNLF